MLIHPRHLAELTVAALAHWLAHSTSPVSAVTPPPSVGQMAIPMAYIVGALLFLVGGVFFLKGIGDLGSIFWTVGSAFFELGSLIFLALVTVCAAR